MAEDAELLPEGGSLVLQAAGGITWLAHTVTQERVALQAPPAGEAWELCFTDDGVGYVDSGSTSLWAHEQLKLSLYAAPDGTTWVSTSSGSQVKTLQDFKTEHEIAKIAVPISVGGLEAEAAMFRRNAGGRVWWNLLDVSKGCKLTLKGGSTRWVHKRIQAWERFCTKLGLDAIHLRRSRAYEGAASQLDADRVLTFPAVSTHLLLGICARLVGLPMGSGGLQQEEDKASIKAFLQGCLQLPGKDLTFTVFMDSSCTWQPPLPLAGSRPVTLSMHGGTVDVTPLHAALADPLVVAHAGPQALGAAFNDLPAQLCMADLLVAAVSCGAQVFRVQRHSGTPPHSQDVLPSTSWRLSQLLWKLQLHWFDLLHVIP